MTQRTKSKPRYNVCFPESNFKGVSRYIEENVPDFVSHDFSIKSWASINRCGIRYTLYTAPVWVIVEPSGYNRPATKGLTQYWIVVCEGQDKVWVPMLVEYGGYLDRLFTEKSMEEIDNEVVVTLYTNEETLLRRTLPNLVVLYS